MKAEWFFNTLYIYKYISPDLCEAYNSTGKCQRCSNSMTFLSPQLVEIDKNYWLTLPQWNSLCHRLSRDQPQPGSFFQRPNGGREERPWERGCTNHRFASKFWMQTLAIWENACRLLLPGASRRMFAQRLLLQEPVRRLYSIANWLICIRAIAWKSTVADVTLKKNTKPIFYVTMNATGRYFM